MQPSPTDGSIWGQSMDTGFSRIDQPGYLIRFIPGPDPTNTGLTEIFQPPPGSFSPRGIDVDSGGNLLLRTNAAGNLTNYDIAANNRYGPIIDLTAAAGAPVLGNAAASTLTSADATANYAH